MFGPGQHDESTVFVGYLEAQLEAIRASAYGLTEEQARATPCRSALSIGGLIKHSTYVMTSHLRRRADPTATPNEADVALFLGSFALTSQETLAGALDAFDTARHEYLALIRATDPAAEDIEPAAPWDGRFQPDVSVKRFALMHHVEELARHAGHADILREQLDGADAMSLKFAVQGLPANDFVQPWQPSAS